MENVIQTDAKVPASYWIVAALGTVWNAFGGYLYTMTKLDEAAMVAGAPPAMQAYVAQMPLWAHVGWSLGIWGSVAGSVLMLLRSRHAGTAFLVSLVGAIASFTAQAAAGVLDAPQPVMILSVIVLLWWYCRRSALRGILR